MNDQDLISRVRQLQIRCRGLIDHDLIGSYQSSFKGAGIEYEESRPYQPGDDIRTIDWRLTARLTQPYVKLYRQERQASIHLLLDTSGSMSVPGFGRTPADVARETASVLAMLASSQDDQVGLMLFADTIRQVIPPAGGTQHALWIMRQILSTRDNHERTDLTAPLERLCRTWTKRCIVFLFSDFLASGHEPSLRIAARMHDLIPVVVGHLWDRQLPSGGMLTARDPETGRTVRLDAYSRRQRDRYKQSAQDALDQQLKGFARLRLTPLILSTGDDIAVQLHRYFDRRGVMP